MTVRFMVVAATVLALGTAGFAQEATEGAPADAPKRSLQAIEPAAGITNETLTDEKLRSFVQALAAVRVVGQHFVPRIEAETNGPKRAELMDYANDSIVNAIDVIAGISPAEYKAIDIAAQQDPALNQRILDEIKQAAVDGKAAAEAEAKAAKEAEGAEKAE